ncbi:hypothetical protein PTSG_05469 [Salpingoeca rosetta]|uniref:Uncharacterized protein n=1 Tax=Salpingoeca rosetta (strain ATCC 50818 / BSB-021) TaxID=946362 RepID=F2UBB0_SALR5|nr:uncharacterized protein PTSG_05469 [Salpingoeca rosetta]EGD73776.1 hypothetical protein PTSG_05469 [Salpingoeca rosetta]|eukprot:XP_004993339.1 hypothetical protein PTSG_05469 [Salpingoeca rosetta]
MSDDEMWWEPSKNLVAESSENEDEGSPVTDHDVSEQPAKKAKRQQKKEKKQKKGNKAKTDSDTLGTAEGDGDKKSAQAKRRAKKADKFAQKQRELRELYTSGAEGAREVLWNVITKDMSKTMTDLELEQVQLKAEHIVHADVKSRSKGRQLTAFCKAVTGTKKRLPHPKKKGDPPTLIVISVSAKRCVEVKPKIAAIAPSSVLKLFAKHMKQSEQEKRLQRSWQQRGKPGA